MDFLGGALPNVMFIVGILAVGLGLGIELKLVPLNKEINRGGRIGAFLVGLALIAGSIMMYRNPSLVPQPSAAAGATAVSSTTTAPVDASVVHVANGATTATPAAAPTAGAVTASGITVPDLHGSDDKSAQRKLQEAGLHARKVDTCSGADQGDSKTKKGRVQCQNPAAGAAVAPGATVEYVLAGK